MTLLLDSCFSSSQAIQKSMFSSLNSVRRNSRKAFLPAGVSISLSNDWAQALTSSRVGAGLEEEGEGEKREMNDCYSSCLQLAGGICHHHGPKSTGSRGSNSWLELPKCELCFTGAPTSLTSSEETLACPLGGSRVLLTFIIFRRLAVPVSFMAEWLGGNRMFFKMISDCVYKARFDLPCCQREDVVTCCISIR